MFIPIESQIEKFQDEYYDAIAKCHTEGSSDTFILFILEQIDKILAEIAEQISASAENWLTVPTAKPVADFHRQVITHAERTQKSQCKKQIYIGFFC